MKKILITGGLGFVGQHLSTALSSDESNKIFCIDTRLDPSIDIRSYEEVRRVLDLVRPDYVYHLAAQPYVPESFANPIRTFEVNTLGTVNLLEAVKDLGLKPKILLVGTSEEYGDVYDNVTTEDTLPNPRSPYGISKLAMEHMGNYYTNVHDLNIVITRSFNHIGAGHPEQYAIPFFAKQIALIEKGVTDDLHHGDLDVVKNYTDVRDIIRAYRMLIECKPGVYNVCSNNNVKIGEVLDILISKTECKVNKIQDRSLRRITNVDYSKPSYKKLNVVCGWKPMISLDKSLQDVLDYWRGQV